VTAVLHHLSPSATIIGIDHLPGLVDLAKSNLARDGVALGSAHDASNGTNGSGMGGVGRVEVVLGDGRKGTLHSALLTLPRLYRGTAMHPDADDQAGQRTVRPSSSVDRVIPAYRSWFH
jgi:hypothetical protein